MVKSLVRDAEPIHQSKAPTMYESLLLCYQAYRAWGPTSQNLASAPAIFVQPSQGIRWTPAGYRSFL